jgi:hypothetical protein
VVRRRPSVGHRPAGVEINFGGGYEGLPVSRSGTYSSGLNLPPGHYTVEFAAIGCSGTNPGNWAPQWYRNQTAARHATRVTVRAGRMSRGIGGHLRHGGIITGTIATRSGRAAPRGCVGLFTPAGAYLSQQNWRHDRYSFRGLPGGSYRVLFVPTCGNATPYLQQWWRDQYSFSRATSVRVRYGERVAGIGARLQLGGTLTGTVRYQSASGAPLSGICVDATRGQYDYEAATDAAGGYSLTGLSAGRYHVYFSPGCNNNGDYLGDNYPHPVPVTVGHTVRGIDGVLHRGAIISGQVTAPGGRPLRGIEIVAQDARGDFGAACSGPSGGYAMRQLQKGQYTVSFASGCGAAGSWAPQYYPAQAAPGAAVPVPVRAGQRVTGVDATMAPGAVITGVVTAARGGAPARAICVSAQTPGGAADSGPGTETGRTGRYRIANLSAGRYTVSFVECGTPRYADRWFGGGSTGELVDVGVGATVRGISAAVAPGGAITGTTVDRRGQPADGVCEIATNRRTGAATGADDFLGNRYGLSGLSVGRYRVAFDICPVGTKYQTQWYRGQPTPATATPVPVTGAHITRRISATLVPGGTITGMLTSAGQPVGGFCVEAVSLSRALSQYEQVGVTRKDGSFSVPGLSTGRYYLAAVANCFGGTATPASVAFSRVVRVTAPRTVTGVRLTVSAGGSFSGTVTTRPASAGPGDVCVEADPLSARAVQGFGLTSASGRYTVANLRPGRYRVYFDTRGYCDDSTDGLVPQWYSGAGSRRAATVITVPAGRGPSGIDATLTADGGIAGTVTAGGRALAGACVRAVPVKAGQMTSLAATVRDGGYALTGIVPGRYRVEFSSGCGATGYATQWWRDAASAGAATEITVVPAAVTSGISAQLRR